MSALDEVRARIAAAATAAGRDPAEVALVAVSKFHPAAAVAALRDQGQADFGESRAQELTAKAAEVAGVRWHFVGRLQTNKARAVAAVADVVHSVDRPDLVAALGRADRAVPLEVLLQVSLDGDPERGGAHPDDVPALADLVAGQPALRLAGVMAVAVPDLPVRPQLAGLRVLAERLRRDHPGAVEISAGMSGDLEEAVAEGATVVRVGTALFGPRPSR